MIRINLLADRHFKDRLIIQQQVTLGLGMLLATLLLCGLWYQSKAMAISDTNEKIEAAERKLATQKGIRDQVAAMEAQEKRVQAILEAITFLKTMQGGPTLYFDTLNILLPADIWLTSIQDKSGKQIISGFSFSQTAVAKLMTSMKESGKFFNIELKVIKQAKLKKETLKEFTIEAMTALGKKIAAQKAKEAARLAAERSKNKKGKKRGRGRKK